MSVEHLAVVARAIASDRSRRAKVTHLSGLLRQLDDLDLAPVVRYFAGQTFPTGDPRTLNLGGAALRDALLNIPGIDSTELGRLWRRFADAGDCVHAALGAASHHADEILTVDVLVATLGAIAEASSVRRRQETLVHLINACAPEAAWFVIKVISGDMRIGLRHGLVEEAIAVAFDRPASAVARADMLRSDLGEVAVLARHDRLGEASVTPFVPLRFMLATPTVDAHEVVRRQGDEVWIEDKYDGIRCQLHRCGGEVRLYSRDLRDITVQFPDIEEAAQRLPQPLILDGEVVAFANGQVRPFAELQRRLGRRRVAPALRAAVPVAFVAWDVLLAGNGVLLDRPLRERRMCLESLELIGAVARAHRETARGAAEVDALFSQARGRLNEGLIAKDPDSPYSPGRRGMAWLKLKRPMDTLDVVVVGAEWGNGRRRDVLSDVTFAVRRDGGDELLVVGKAYTGLTDAEIATLTADLMRITVVDHGHYREVIPTIVLEVAFDTVQVSARHSSGFALRFPRIVRRRADRTVADIDTLGRVRALAMSASGAGRQTVDQGAD